MASLLNALVLVGPYTLIAGLLVALLFYASARTAGGSFRSYALRVLVAGTAAFVAGSVLGIGAFCAPADAGNLCGLGGVLGLGPFVSGLVMAIYARQIAKSARRL